MTDTRPAAASDRVPRCLATESLGIPVGVQCFWIFRYKVLHLIQNQPASQAALTWLSDNTRSSHTLSAVMQRQVTKDIGKSWHLWDCNARHHARSHVA